MGNQHSKKGRVERTGNVLKTMPLIPTDSLNLVINQLDI